MFNAEILYFPLTWETFWRQRDTIGSEVTQFILHDIISSCSKIQTNRIQAINSEKIFGAENLIFPKIEKSSDDRRIQFGQKWPNLYCTMLYLLADKFKPTETIKSKGMNVWCKDSQFPEIWEISWRQRHTIRSKVTQRRQQGCFICKTHPKNVQCAARREQ